MLVETVAQVHEKFSFLSEPHYAKVMYGGRDGMKSWAVAQQLVIDGTQRPLRTLCARETQKSMKESVHRLLSDTIKRLSLVDFYEIQHETIFSKPFGDQGRTEFIFSGIRDAQNIKSYENCDRVWVEEAQVVSEESWQILVPTLRKNGAEFWITFNPILATDPTYERWVLNPPPGTVIVKVGWEDNPWLSDTSRVTIEHMRATNPKQFEHIYGGECVSEVEGAIFTDELRKAEAEGRIGTVPHDPTKPVHTAWDLGFFDPTCIWFVQPRDGYLCFIDYISRSEKTIGDLIIELQQKPYIYGEDHLPWDCVDSMLHHRLLGVGNQMNSIPNLMRAAGRKVIPAPKLDKRDALNAARTLFALSKFDAEKCKYGLNALRHYQWDRTELEPGKRKPLHDSASHGSDGFLTAAVSIKREKHEEAYTGNRKVRYETVI